MTSSPQILGEAARAARRLLVIANFIPWGEGAPVIRRDPQGFYLNTYRRSDVYECAAASGWKPLSVTSTLEKDERPNEVVVFTPAKPAPEKGPSRPLAEESPGLE